MDSDLARLVLLERAFMERGLRIERRRWWPVLAELPDGDGHWEYLLSHGDFPRWHWNYVIDIQRWNPPVSYDVAAAATAAYIYLRLKELIVTGVKGEDFDVVVGGLRLRHSPYHYVTFG